MSWDQLTLFIVIIWGIIYGLIDRQQERERKDDLDRD